MSKLEDISTGSHILGNENKKSNFAGLFHTCSVQEQTSRFTSRNHDTAKFLFKWWGSADLSSTCNIKNAANMKYALLITKDATNDKTGNSVPQ
jgi:hypothetical protein